MSKFSDTLNPEDVKLLLMAKDQILAAPARYFKMTFWSEQINDACGTAFCIGGHMAILMNPKWVHDRLSCSLISDWISQHFDEGYNFWGSLFMIENWPDKFISSKDSRSDWSTTPELAAARIDHWLETGE